MSRFAKLAFAPALGLTLVLSVAATPLAAQQQLPTRYAERARPTAVSQEDIQNAIARGDVLANRGQYAQARREYRAAADMQLRNGELPESALWQVATMHYADRDLKGTAAALDELATKAAAHGQPDVQAKAMLESAFLHSRVGNTARAHEIARDLRVLIKSPYVSDELRTSIDKRLSGA
jgi:hypothetical protein